MDDLQVKETADLKNIEQFYILAHGQMTVLKAYQCGIYTHHYSKGYE